MDALPAPDAEVLQRHARFVAGLARELLADEHQADDLSQDTWLRFLRRPPRSGAATRGWLRRVTRRLSTDSHRSRSRRSAREERAARPEALPSVAEELERTEVLRSVAEAVLALDEPYRSCVLLAYWRGWDARRIADETGTPVATVRSRLQRAHARLREGLDRRHGRETWALALAPLLPLRSGLVAAVSAAVVLVAVVAGVAWSVRPGSDDSRVTVAAAGPEPGREESVPAADGQAVPRVPGEREEVPAGAAPDVVRVVGTLVDRAYAPLELPQRPSAGIRVTALVSRSSWGANPSASAQAVTDADGRFELDLPWPGTEQHHLIVRTAPDERYRPAVHRGELTGRRVELALVRVAHGLLEGSVLDDADAPLAGAAVRVDDVELESDADGRFALPHATSAGPIEASLPGWTKLSVEEPRWLDDGGYTPAVVRMGPDARLRVRVVERDGAPIEGARVTARLAPAEQALLPGESRRSAREETGPDGVAEIAGVWAARKLEVTVQVSGQTLAGDAQVSGNLLVEREAHGGRPVVIEPGGVFELELRLDVEREVAGTVSLPDGSPVPEASVEVTDLGREGRGNPPILVSATTGQDGRFAGTLRTTSLVGPLRVRAVAPALAPSAAGQPAGLGYLGSADPGAPGDVPCGPDAPEALVEVSPLDADRLGALELVLEERLTITGVVLEPEGEERRGGRRLWAVEAGAPTHRGGAFATTTRGQPGFTFHGLRPRNYDLFVSEELEGFYTYENFLHRFPGIPAGARDVELRLPEERREVRIRVRLTGGEPRRGIVLHRRVFPLAEVPVPAAAGVVRVEGGEGWPYGTSFGFTGIGGPDIALGGTSDGYDGFEGDAFELRPLGPGLYVIGVDASAGEGGPGYYPQATPLLRFEEGEYLVEFALQPGATLRGRVVGGSTEEFMAVQLVDAEHRALTVAPQSGFGESAKLVETGADGSFVVRQAPCGELRLRVGSRAELRAGRYRRELPVTIVPGVNPALEIRL